MSKQYTKYLSWPLGEIKTWTYTQGLCPGVLWALYHPCGTECCSLIGRKDAVPTTHWSEVIPRPQDMNIWPGHKIRTSVGTVLWHNSSCKLLFLPKLRRILRTSDKELNLPKIKNKVLEYRWLKINESLIIPNPLLQSNKHERPECLGHQVLSCSPQHELSTSTTD